MNRFVEQSKNGVCAISNVDTSIEHSISCHSTSTVKGCVGISLIWWILPLVKNIDCLLISSGIFQGKRQ